MWQPLITSEQLLIGQRLRTHFVEGDNIYSTEYIVIKIGQRYFLKQADRYNGQVIVEQHRIIIPHVLANVPYLGMEMWVDN